MQDLFHCFPLALGVPIAPAELQRQPGEQASLSGTDGARAREDAVVFELRVFGAMPQVGDHVDGRVVQFIRLGIYRLVGEVHPQTHEGDGLLLALKGDVHVGGSIQPVIEIERMRVFHHQLDGLSIQPGIGNVL